MILEILPEPGFLHAKAAGQFSLEDAKKTFMELLDAVAQRQVKKVLFDGRELSGEPEPMERFYYGKFAAGAVVRSATPGVSPATQFAFVLKEPVLDPEKFGETVAVNRGMLVRAFETPGEALQWLGVAPANGPRAGDGKPA
jgi:hypothetical protein